MKKYYIRDADNDTPWEYWHTEGEGSPEASRLGWCYLCLAQESADSPEDAVGRWMDGQLKDGNDFDTPALVEVYDEDGDLEGTFEALERVEVIREITPVRRER